MGETLYARLIVGCDWEGETRAFYFQASRDQFDLLGAIVKDADDENGDRYTLQDLGIPLEAVLFLIEYANINATNYVSQHSFIGRLISIPNNIEDLYKTGICDFADTLNVTVPEEPTIPLECAGLQHYINNKVSGIAAIENVE